MRTIPIASILALSLPLAAAVPALAQGTTAQREACSGDAFRLCASSMPSADKVAACLRREKEQLSPACRGVFEAAEGGRQKSATTAEKPAPAPATKEASKPEPEPTRTAEKPHPADAQPKSRIAGAAGPRRLPVAEAAPKQTAPTQSTESRSQPKRDAVKQVAKRPTAPAKRAAITREAVLSHRHRKLRDQSDFAQANYWMKRVTGVSIGNLAGMLPN